MTVTQSFIKAQGEEHAMMQVRERGAGKLS